MTDIYSAPQATLISEKATNEHGSVAKALAGDYTVAVGGTLREAWQRTKGNKGKIWLAVLLYIIGAVVVSYFAGVITGYSAFDPEIAAEASIFAELLYQLLITIALFPLGVGMMMLGVKIARDEEFSVTEVFAHYDKIVPLTISVLLMYLLCAIGFVLLVIPGVYLLIAYMMAALLIADKKMGPWQALETSRKAITKHWFAVFGFSLVLSLLCIAGTLALLIGLIWAIPTVSIAYGILYRNMFGGPDADTEAVNA